MLGCNLPRISTENDVVGTLMRNPSVANHVCMNRRFGLTLRSIKQLLLLVWRAFRKSPPLFQWLVWGAATGAFVVGVLVGDMGLAAMGSAIGISGVGAGAVLGLLIVYVPWSALKAVRQKHSK